MMEKIMEELAKYGINSKEELYEALETYDGVDLGLFVSETNQKDKVA